jgi:hypothetical protein
MFDLKYCNWNKDMLMGVLPNSQFGDVAVIDIPNSGVSDVVLGPDNKKSKVGVASAVSSSSAPVPFFALQASASNTVPAASTLRVDLSTLQSQFTVLALRQAEALQRWKEISQSGDSDYREQIRKHFGVNLPQALSNMCTYIGGISRNLDISEVVNNNLATGLARAQLGYSKEMQELDNMAFAGRLLQAQGTSQLLDAEAKTVLNKYLDQQQQADLNVKASEYYNQNKN